ncbi:MAG: endo-1,4-beta-xylanase [Flexilinea sp.]
MKKISIFIILFVTLLFSYGFQSVQELERKAIGFTETELMDSGRVGIAQSDGTFFYEGFYIAPNGNYFPINENALKGEPISTSTATPAALTQEVLSQTVILTERDLTDSEQKILIDVVSSFVNAQIKAGIQTSLDEILKQGLITNEVIGADGKTYQIASTQDGYPLMVKTGEKAWEKMSVKVASEIAGLDSFGSLIEYRSNSELYPELDELYGDEFNLGIATFLWRDQHSKTDIYENGWPDWEISRAKKVGINNYRLHALLFSDSGEGMNAYINFSREQLIEEINKTIEFEMEHLIKNGVKEFVVVNESFYSGSGRNDLFQNIIGSDYVTIAFQKARAVALQNLKEITLIYNDYENQYSNTQQTEHTKKVIESLKKDNLIDVVGVEMHLRAAEGINYSDISKTLSGYDLPVYVTEMSIDMTDVTDLQNQASIWECTIKAILASKNCRSISVWGIGDKYSWEASSGKPNANSSLFDDNMEPKLQLYALQKAMIESVE